MSRANAATGPPLARHFGVKGDFSCPTASQGTATLYSTLLSVVVASEGVEGLFSGLIRAVSKKTV